MATNEQSPPRLTVAELLAIPVVAGALAGALFGVADVWLHVREPLPTDVLWATMMGVPPAVLALTGVCVALALVWSLLLGRPERAPWVGSIVVAAAIGMATTVLMLTRDHLSVPLGVALLLGAALGGAVVALLVLRVPALARPGVAVSGLLALLLALLVAAGGTLHLVARGWPAAAALLPGLAGIGLAAALASLRRGRWYLVGGLLLVLVLLWLVGDPTSPRPARELAADGRPNVVVIVLDTTRRDHLGSYGDTRGLTPRLDALAAESVVYDEAFSTSHWTVPSHASLFTGLHPPTHGCTRLERLWLEDRFVTLAEMLADEGYATAALYSNLWIAQANQLQGFETRVYLDRHYIGSWLLPLAASLGAPARWIDKGAARSVPELAHWLAQERPAGVPFFLFVNLLEAHSRFVTPRRYRAQFLPEGAGYLRAGALAREFEPTDWQLTGDDHPEAERLIPAMYAAEVRYQDVILGRLLDLLREATDFDRNLIVVTSDHGENLHEGGRWGHEFAVNDALVRVPLIVRYPSPGPGAARVVGMCQLTDVLPTVLEAVGLSPPEGIAGRSLAPASFRPWDALALHGAAQYAWLGKHYSLQHLSEREFLRLTAHKRVWRTPEFKYVWSSDGRHELYDLDRDPLELSNVIAELPEVALGLHRNLEQWWRGQPAFTPGEGAEESRPMSEEAIEQLRSLGYVQ